MKAAVITAVTAAAVIAGKTLAALMLLTLAAASGKARAAYTADAGASGLLYGYEAVCDELVDFYGHGWFTPGHPAYWDQGRGRTDQGKDGIACEGERRRFPEAEEIWWDSVERVRQYWRGDQPRK